jgi:serine/threonine-protein kinase RIO1
MVSERHVLHGDLSPNNIIIHEGKGYFIDFDHAKVLQRGTAVEKRGIVS